MPGCGRCSRIVALFDGKVLAGEVAPGGDDGADPVRRHHARPSLPRARAPSRSRASPTTSTKLGRRTSCSIRRSARRSSWTVPSKLCAAGAGRAAGPTRACSTRWRAWSNGRCRCSAPSMRQFMDVPPEVLTVSMRTHQRYFVTDQKRRHARQPLRRRRQQRGARRRQDDRRRQRARAARAPVRRQVLLGPGPQGPAGGAAAGAEGHRLPRQARHAGRARRAHRRRWPARSPTFVPAPMRRRSMLAAQPVQGRPRDRHGRRVPRAAGRHGPLLRAATRSCRPPSPTRSAITMRRPARTTAARARRSRSPWRWPTSSTR